MHLYPRDIGYEEVLRKYHNIPVILIRNSVWRIPEALPQLIKFNNKTLISKSSDLDFEKKSNMDYPDGVILFFARQEIDEHELSVDDIQLATGLHNATHILEPYYNPYKYDVYHLE